MSQYLGDGVYLSHDGYQLWLAANHHENDVIAMEPAVYLAFIKAGYQMLKLIHGDSFVEEFEEDMKEIYSS